MANELYTDQDGVSATLDVDAGVETIHIITLAEQGPAGPAGGYDNHYSEIAIVDLGDTVGEYQMDSNDCLRGTIVFLNGADVTGITWSDSPNNPSTYQVLFYAAPGENDPCVITFPNGTFGLYRASPIHLTVVGSAPVPLYPYELTSGVRGDIDVTDPRTWLLVDGSVAPSRLHADTLELIARYSAQILPTDPTAVGSTPEYAGVMVGVNPLPVSPRTGTSFVFTLTGEWRNTTASESATMRLYHVGSSAVAEGSTVQGGHTAIGRAQTFTNSDATTPGWYPFSIQARVSNASPGTAVAVDLAVSASGASAAAVRNLTMMVVEV